MAHARVRSIGLFLLSLLVAGGCGDDTSSDADGTTTLLLPDLSATESLVYTASPAARPDPGAVIALQPRRGDSSLHGEAQILFQGSALQNVTVTPDFPRNPALARAMWTDDNGLQVDGVGSAAPVALS